MFMNKPTYLRVHLMSGCGSRTEQEESLCG